MTDADDLYRCVCFGDGAIDGAVKKLITRFAARTNEFDYGRNRITFMFDKYVVKVPRNWDGVADNDWEGSISNGANYGDPQHVQYARTRLAYWDDLPIVFMERVALASVKEVEEHLGTAPGESDWTWSVDGGQVGFNRNGRLVAYDYGCR